MNRAGLVSVSLIAMTLLAGCVGQPPNADYTLAHTAMEAAKSAQAPRVAPGYFSRADEIYQRAVAEYQDRHYSRAQKDFREAMFYAEQAENFSALKRAETGEAN